MPKTVALLLVLTSAVAAGCGREPAVFSDENARVTIGMLAGTIGSRPVGTPANAQARAYLTDQLRLFGFDVRVQETDARRAELGRTARVSNIIAVRQGVRDEAIGLLSHYDSAPESPGAADDGFGVAVTLEAARVLAARTDRQWSLMVLMTDGEEAGLMGAAALMTDREVTRRLQTYINVESAGSSDPVMLFETGPGQRLVDPPMGAICAASARCVVRRRDLQAPAERHGLLHSQAPGYSGPQLRRGRRQLRLSHRARHGRAHSPARRSPRRPERRRHRQRARRVRHHRALVIQPDLLRHRRHGGCQLRTVHGPRCRRDRTLSRRRRMGSRHRGSVQDGRRRAVAADRRLDHPWRGACRRGHDWGNGGASRCPRGLSPLVRAARPAVPAASGSRHDGRLGCRTPWRVPSRAAHADCVTR